jgi:hypothetical protein
MAVVPDAVWYGTVPADPPAKFVAVVANVAVPPAVVTNVPLVLGNVRIVEPAADGACRVTVPETSPPITNALLFYPFTK